ncbi:MAG: hypothetical protein E4H20_00740 [Spirochaetales bacterium]|nr:MAG: hypothetical protein E4H20_00740 [Spirochaetales bacterium]
MSDSSNAHGGIRDNAGLGGLDTSGSGSPRPCKDDRHGFDMDTWWEDRSLPQKILWGIGFALLGIGLLALFGWIVMLLWNWLMPDIFGLKRLDYWQAWGLLALCTILFKGMHFQDDSRGTDRRRKRQLRSYMQEDLDSAGESSVDIRGYPAE